MAHPIPKKQRIINTARWYICEEVLTQHEKDILRLIEERKMSQTEIAELFGISQPAISHAYTNALDKVNPIMKILTETIDKILEIYI